MKKADDMLSEIVRVVDTSGDGKIQYEGSWEPSRARCGAWLAIPLGLTVNLPGAEFRVFVEAAERQLLLLFRSIDKDKDGRLDRNELQTAFQRSGITVSRRRLNGFFDEIDVNNDGFIGFDEWRYVLTSFAFRLPLSSVLILFLPGFLSTLSRVFLSVCSLYIWHHFHDGGGGVLILFICFPSMAVEQKWQQGTNFDLGKVTFCSSCPAMKRAHSWRQHCPTTRALL